MGSNKTEPLDKTGQRRFRLLIINDAVNTSHPLPDSGEFTIGRGAHNDVAIESPSVSRTHARLKLGSELSIEDLGSANGTRVRGQVLEVGKPVEIWTDEVVDVGQVMIILQRRGIVQRARRVWTHGYFEARLEEECLRASRQDTQFAVLRVRGSGRHPGAIEAAVFETVRASDIVGSYGPSEYEILLLGAGSATADRLADRLREQMDDAGELHVGVACYPRDGATADQLVEHAGTRARRKDSDGGRSPAVVVEDDAMQRLHRLIERIAVGNISVLLHGETGVGKEVLAERIHNQSKRASGPFVRLNCAALTDTLLESELFGHERGAFTGAVAAKSGLLETAEGGTVLLDEIGEMSLALQSKLLRVIDERQVLRVGAIKPRPIDVRFVSATNRDLEWEVERDNFRRDLYFRLNGICIQVPPLRERRLEIEPLVRTFLAAVSQQSGHRTVPKMSQEALEICTAYSWPGNIRELRNVIERAVLLCASDVITPEHLPTEKMVPLVSLEAPGNMEPERRDDTSAEPDGEPVAKAAVEPMRSGMAEVERARILRALEETNGNQKEAAKLLGVSRRTLIHRLEKYNISGPRKRR